MAGGMDGMEHEWQGVMHGREASMVRDACMAGGICGRGPCVARGAPPGRYYEIPSMSGRYALYWNAFLLH